MQNLHTLTLTLITGLLATLPAHAQDDTQTYGTWDKSVTIYSLDGPPAPIEIANPAPVRGMDRYSETYGTYEAAAAHAASNIETSTGATQTATNVASISPDAGWLGAVWNGRANIGASLQTGNTEQDAINADAMVKAKWADIHRATLKAELNIENEDDTTTEDNKRIEGQYDYFFAPQWFLNSSLSFEQDDIDQLDLRTTAGLGLGHQPFESEELNLQYALGPTYLREEFENGNEEDSIAGRWALEYDQKIWDNALQLFHEHELLVPGDDTDGYLLDTKTGLRVPLVKGLIGTAEIEYDRDNNPEPGVKKDDTTYAAKLGYEW